MRKNPISLAKAYFQKPYPYKAKRGSVLILLPLFISLFILIFQPFGLHNFKQEHKDLLLVGYGFVTFLVLLLNMYIIPWIFPRLFREGSWTILSQIIYLLWIIFSIGISNYFYSILFSITRWSGIYGLLIFIGFTFAIGFIPVLILIIVSHNIMLRKNLFRAGELASLLNERKDSIGKEKQETLSLCNESKQDSLELTPNQLIFIESEGNYINAFYLKDGKILCATLRNTLKNIEEQIANAPGFFRCHRAFIVNLSHIVKAEGNSQGYRLQMKYVDKQVPVSRNYTRAFNQAFRDQE